MRDNERWSTRSMLVKEMRIDATRCVQADIEAPSAAWKMFA